ncbi:hypothetical protein [Streptomyces sp. NPDC006527]|uniref:hypothetical protein n=1 Tax=Streptomyces sp. NPDC006527 TaxID=3364749 RepID=UPI00369A7A84
MESLIRRGHNAGLRSATMRQEAISFFVSADHEPPPPGAMSDHGRMRPPWQLPRSLRVAAWVMAVVSLTALALGAMLRSTVLDPDFYRQALDKERAYQRLYDEVLADPAARTSPGTCSGDCRYRSPR